MRRLATLVLPLLVACGGSNKPPADATANGPDPAAVPAPAPAAMPAPVDAPTDAPADPDGAPPDVGPPAPAPGDVARCGGIAGFTCDEGKRCIDDPSDDCDPTAGGADCMGLCVGNQVPECPDTETKRYIATMEMCKRIRYRCAASETPFGDDCGCGCQTNTGD